MGEASYHIPPGTHYRRVLDELVTFQIDTGCFYYFSAETEAVFDYFRKPRTIPSLLSEIDRSAGEDEVQYVRQFIQFLKKNQLLKEVTAAPERPTQWHYVRPRFHRRGDVRLDVINRVCV